MATKRVFKRASEPVDATAFIDAAPYSSGQVAAEPVKAGKGSGVEAQLHVLMPKADIVALKRAALDRGKTVSDLVRESVQVYINTK
jgi:hypothetical protein